MRRRKSIRNIFLALLLIFSVFFGSPGLYADTITNYFDGLLSNNEYVLYTDIEVNNDDSLQSMLSQSFSGSVYSEYWNSWQDYSQLSLAPTICSYGSHTCNIELVRHTYSAREVVKEYQNVNIIIDSNIGSYFPMFNNDDIEINYDESMFSSDEEKQNYISSYIMNNYRTSDGSQNTYYSYEPYSAGVYVVHRNENSNGRMVKHMIKKVNSVVFNYVEEPYSAEFEKLTTGVLAVKTDADINDDSLSRYLSGFSGGFSLDGKIKNNKVFIKLSKWEDNHSTFERHLVTITKDSNINMSLFSNGGFGDKITIRADVPANKVDFLNNYFNMTQYYTENTDGSHDLFEDSVDYNNPSLAYVVYIKKDEHYEVQDVQMRVLPIEFAGYDDTYSEEYTEMVGNTLIINADTLSNYNIQMRLPYKTHLLGCADDYSTCDVALYDYESGKIEIHKVNIVLDNTVSDTFKSLFKIKGDGTIDVAVSDGVLIDWRGIYASYYNEQTGDYLRFECNGSNKCDLYLVNYSKNVSETHTVNYAVKNANRSQFYGSLVKESVDAYPGESTNVWNDIANNTWSLFVKKNSNSSSPSSAGCDNVSKQCTIALVNSDRILEIHNSSVNIKEGKSPEYSAIMPTDTLELNAVAGNDDIIYYASQAYFLSKTKSYSYLQGYHDNKGKIVFNGLEKHTVNVSLAQEKQEAREEINQAIGKIGRQSFKFVIDDLEYVNLFYYKDPAVWNLGNYNSKSINDIFSKIVNNKHIGYYFVEQGGMGDNFTEEASGGLLLYYDGVAYDDANAAVTTNVNHVIYVPDDTSDGAENYVKAAQERINDYLGTNSGVTVSYSKRFEGDSTWLSQYMDMTGFDGNKYQISYKDRTEDVLILKNTSKMQDSTFVASDVNNNITVSSNNANYPTNTVVSAENLDENTDSNKALLKKLGLKKAQVVNIDLYSPTAGDIKDFNGVEFDVNLPIDEDKVEGDELYAYHVSDDGKIEEHPVEKDDFMGKFGVTHFSTYIISGKIDDSIIEKANNPKTYDDISLLVTLFSVSMISLVGIAGLAIRKKNINRAK